MSSLDKKREDFRKYLEKAGAIDNLTKTLIKLYEQQNKPEDAVKFIRKHMCESCPDDEQFEVMTADLDQASKKICELERELARLKGSIKRTASEVDLALTQGFEELQSAGNGSVLQKILTKDVMESLKDKKTKAKGTLLDCIQAGLQIPNTPIGAFACDPEAYTLFAELFDPLIEDLQGYKKEDKQPKSEWGESCKLPDLDPKYMVAIRLIATRSIEGYPFNSIMSMDHYEEIMAKVENLAKCMSLNLKGKFYPTEGMDEELKKMFAKHYVLFSDNNPVLKAANAYRFYPSGRGIFFNEEETLAIWVNEEEHLKFMTTTHSADLRMVYDLMIAAVNQVTKDICVVHNEHLGYVAFNPDNMGNTLQLTAKIRIDKITLHEEKLNEIANNYEMKWSPVNAPGYEGTTKFVSKKRMGMTEFESVKLFAEGLNAVIDADKAL